MRHVSASLIEHETIEYDWPDGMSLGALADVRDLRERLEAGWDLHKVVIIPAATRAGPRKIQITYTRKVVR